MAFTSEQIANLRSLKASGATSVTIQGQTIQLDREDINRMLAEAERSELTSRMNNDTLETRVSMDLSGFCG